MSKLRNKSIVSALTTKNAMPFGEAKNRSGERPISNMHTNSKSSAVVKTASLMGMLLGIIFALYFLVNSSLTILLHAQNEENQEILTVPIQQTSHLQHAYQ